MVARLAGEATTGSFASPALLARRTRARGAEQGADHAQERPPAPEPRARLSAPGGPRTPQVVPAPQVAPRALLLHTCVPRPGCVYSIRVAALGDI